MGQWKVFQTVDGQTFIHHSVIAAVFSLSINTDNDVDVDDCLSVLRLNYTGFIIATLQWGVTTDQRAINEGLRCQSKVFERPAFTWATV